MRLICCHIENFGRLHNLDYDFAEGVNIICRENGWGKSTFSAFLRAMFYGLPGNRRKKAEENERSRFRPWQGGIYGGRLTFEAGGKPYEMTRIFGRKESDDEFELRNLETNLLSRDFSEKIGEELFHLDRDSFTRTVFTGQQDCVSAATDNVNALIAGLTEQAGDMGDYEAALKRLADAANRLTPKRPSGTLYRRAEEIRKLTRETAGREELIERLALCRQKNLDAAITEKNLEKELKIIEAEAEAARIEEEEALCAAAAEKGFDGARKVWRQLLNSRDERRRELEEASSFFPGRTPSCEEIDEYLRMCRELERLETQIQAEALDEDEQNRLTELEERFRERGGLPDPEEVQRKKAEKNMAEEKLRKKAEKRMAEEKPWKKAGLPVIFYGIAGAILLAAGLMGVLLTGKFPVIPGAAALLFAVAAALFWIREERSENDPKESLFRNEPSAKVRDDARKETRKKRNRTLEERNRNLSGDEEQPDMEEKTGPEEVYGSEWGTAQAERREYEYLLKKEQLQEELYVEWSQERRPVIRFLKDLGYTPGEDLRVQLETIRNAADVCEDAGKLLRAAERELGACEAELKRQGIDFTGANDSRKKQSGLPHTEMEKKKKPVSGRPGAEALRRMAEEKREELSHCREEREAIANEMEELRVECDDQENAARRLTLLETRQASEEAGYRRVVAADRLLRKARETLTARYSDPITEHFRKYWETITGYSAAGTFIDADSNVTVEERGRRRETSMLSTGYRDLAGICLRAALADAMYPAERGERPPLILDDPFTNLDDEKIEGALRFLREIGKRYQIIYFTCSGARTIRN